MTIIDYQWLFKKKWKQTTEWKSNSAGVNQSQCDLKDFGKKHLGQVGQVGESGRWEGVHVGRGGEMGKGGM